MSLDAHPASCLVTACAGIGRGPFTQPRMLAAHSDCSYSACPDRAGRESDSESSVGALGTTPAIRQRGQPVQRESKSVLLSQTAIPSLYT